MEIKVERVELPEKIQFNYAELKSELQKKLDYYKKLVYTDAEIQTAKKDKASLNKLKKAINDERIRQEKEYMKPFAIFKGQVNELIQMVDEPIKMIDMQVKTYEDGLKDKKRAEIFDILNSYTLPYGIEAGRLFDEKWLNTAKSMKSIMEEIAKKVEAIQADCETLAGLSEYQDIAILNYQQTLNLRTALQRVQYKKEEQETLKRIEAERTQAKPEPIPTLSEYIEEPAKAEEVKEEQPRQWISFQAYLNKDEAQALNRFMKSRGIHFERI